MPITFDPINKYIKITSPTLDVTAQDLYNASMDWCDERDNLIYDVPMSATGKFSLGGGLFSDIIYRLLSSWKVKWWDGDKGVRIYGTFITDDETPVSVPPDSGSFELTIVAGSSGTIEQTDISLNSFIDDASPSASQFDGDIVSLSSLDNFYNGSVVVFTTGQLKGIARSVSVYTGSTRTFSFNGATGDPDAPFPTDPLDADKFRIIGRIV